MGGRELVGGGAAAHDRPPSSAENGAPAAAAFDSKPDCRSWAPPRSQSTAAAGGKGAPTLKKGRWTADEDKRLQEAVVQHLDSTNWMFVASLVGTRNRRQCYDRWVFHTDANNTQRRGRFSLQEQCKVLKLYAVHRTSVQRYKCDVLSGRSVY